METNKYTCISFPIMNEIDGPFHEFPHDIDALTLFSETELNVWLKSIYLIEEDISKNYESLRDGKFVWKKDEAVNNLHNNITLNKLFDDLDVDPTDEKLKNLLTEEEKDSYFDVLGKDSGFLFPIPIEWEIKQLTNLRANVIVDSISGKYVGHIYSWFEKKGFSESLYAQGIRTSLLNTISRKFGHIQHKGISPILIDSLLKLARLLNLRLVTVVDPIGPMPGILKKLRFINHFGGTNYNNVASDQLNVDKYNFIAFGI